MILHDAASKYKSIWIQGKSGTIWNEKELRTLPPHRSPAGAKPIKSVPIWKFLARMLKARSPPRSLALVPRRTGVEPHIGLP